MGVVTTTEAEAFTGSAVTPEGIMVAMEVEIPAVVDADIYEYSLVSQVGTSGNKKCR